MYLFILYHLILTGANPSCHQVTVVSPRQHRDTYGDKLPLALTLLLMANSERTMILILQRRNQRTQRKAFHTGTIEKWSTYCKARSWTTTPTSGGQRFSGQGSGHVHVTFFSIILISCLFCKTVVGQIRLFSGSDSARRPQVYYHCLRPYNN